YHPPLARPFPPTFNLSIASFLPLQFIYLLFYGPTVESLVVEELKAGRSASSSGRSACYRHSFNLFLFQLP
ncbi:unnamed protein product, partial [Linum tenue]